MVTMPRPPGLESKLLPSREALGDALAYGLFAGAAQTLSHYLFATDPPLPESWEELNFRYAIGSLIVGAATTAYGLRHTHARPLDMVAVLWGAYIGSGIIVPLLHRLDEREHQAEARGMRRAYRQEDGEDVSRPRLRKVSLPSRGRG